MSLGKKQHYRFDYIWHQLAAGLVFHVYALIEEINDSNIITLLSHFYPCLLSFIFFSSAAIPPL